MKHLFLSLFLCITAFAVQAQKFGYVNTSQLLLSMPDIKGADDQLKGYQQELVTKGEQMVKSFEDKYNGYLQRVNQGEMSQSQMQQAEADLAAEQKSIQDYEVQVQQLLAQRKQELYQPILNRVQEVVNQIGKEEGYTMIFDAGIGGIVFAVESDDLMPLLKEKLNIK
jgi:outer membrane protein